jgi:release factor glutamine methyltransferase
MALDGGPDGLDVVRRLVAGAVDFLTPGGRLLVEIGFDQGPKTAALLSERGFADVKILKDLNNHDRIATGVLSGPV